MHGTYSITNLVTLKVLTELFLNVQEFLILRLVEWKIVTDVSEDIPSTGSSSENLEFSATHT
jgi:hypothetical protein